MSIFQITMAILIFMIAVAILLFMVITDIKEYHNIGKLDRDIELQELMIHNQLTSIGKTQELLEFIKYLTGQMVVYEYQTYVTTQDISKITRSMLQGVVETTAKKIYEAISEDVINDYTLVVSDVFLMNYICETTKIMLRDIHDRTVTDIITNA